MKMSALEHARIACVGALRALSLACTNCGDNLSDITEESAFRAPLIALRDSMGVRRYIVGTPTVDVECFTADRVDAIEAAIHAARVRAAAGEVTHLYAFFVSADIAPRFVELPRSWWEISTDV